MTRSWLKTGSDGNATLMLHVQPGASRTEAAGLHGEALKLRLKAPPVDGKANACLIAWLADLLDCPKSAVELLSGASSRQKRVRISGLSREALGRLEELGGS